MSLLESEQLYYKPFKYPWAYDAWLRQQQLHWLAQEIPMLDDVRDWLYKLTKQEKHLLTEIFRFFTQADIDVNNCYMTNYMTSFNKIFKVNEIRMMLSAFSNMETIHIDAYSHLLDTLGFKESEYQAFLQYKEMRDKHFYMQSFNMNSKRDIAKTLAAFGAFMEGLQLFASFAILLNFPRFNKMKGMGQIITFSVRDETLHTESIIKLFLTFISENPEIWDDELKNDIYDICRTVVDHEDKFIDLAFNFEGAIQGITSQEIKDFVRFIANLRLRQLTLNDIYDVKVNPLASWLDAILNAPEFTNFFENRATEYSKAATKGTWEEVF